MLLLLEIVRIINWCSWSTSDEWKNKEKSVKCKPHFKLFVTRFPNGYFCAAFTFGKFNHGKTLAKLTGTPQNDGRPLFVKIYKQHKNQCYLSTKCFKWIIHSVEYVTVVLSHKQYCWRKMNKCDFHKFDYILCTKQRYSFALQRRHSHSLFRLRTYWHSALLALWEGNHRWPVDFHHRWPVNAERVSIAWRHHEHL